jgi:hypothetical protein
MVLMINHLLYSTSLGNGFGRINFVSRFFCSCVNTGSLDPADDPRELGLF